jgi:uncharacterized protein (TIGR00297 family)
MSGALPILQGSHPLWVVALVTVLFASIARFVQGVSLSGAVAGAIVCFVLYASAGPGAFILLALLFILTWGATRFGYQRKQKLGTAEKKEGRTASQVLANVGTVAVCAAIYRWHGNIILLLMISATLAEAAADTVSSEIGQAFSQTTFLVTTGKKVPAGTNGGISLFGTLAGILAAMLISLAALFSGLLTWKWLLFSTGAAIAAMLIDSILGATIERRGLLNNDGVNFLSTLLAAAIAYGLA